MMRNSIFRFRAVMLLSGLLGAAGISFGIRLQEAPSDLLKAADGIMERVTALRGLQAKGPIQKGVKSRGEISKFLEAHVRDNYDESELQSEGKLLKKLGLIPPSLDYKAYALRLLTEQVGGYYDPEKKTFFIAAWLPIDQQKPVMAHELTHALQDQHFDLGRFQKEDRKLHNDDRGLAHQAVFEGDAMAVMLDYLLEPMGSNFTKLPNLVMVMRQQQSSMDAQFEVFRQAPMYLKEGLLFPYGYGATFLQKLRSAESWDSVNKIYSDLPASTEQIIHPEKYFEERDDPRIVEVPDPLSLLGTSWRAAYRNVLGEFSLYLMLKLLIPDEAAKNAAAGWGGDQVLLVEETGGETTVFFSSVWDTPQEADQFYQAMISWLKARFPDAKSSEDPAAGLEYAGAGEYHALRRDGDRVRFIVGLPESHSAKIKAW